MTEFEKKQSTGSFVKDNGSVFLFTGLLLLFAAVIIVGGTSITSKYMLVGQSEIHENLRGDIHDLHTRIQDARDYESQLAEKASHLQTLLSEAVEFDPNNGLSPVDLDAVDDEGGIGGGFVSQTPTISMRAARLAGKKAQLPSLLEFLDNQIDHIKSVPIGFPTSGRITSTYGKRRSPFSRRWHMHHGIDIAVDRKSEVVSVADGVVIHAGYKGAYGRMIKIDHGNGIETVYGHLSRIKVTVGQKVCRGQRIGLVGSTGRSTGPHLHYEVRENGKPKDPYYFLQLAGLMNLIRPGQDS